MAQSVEHAPVARKVMFERRTVHLLFGQNLGACASSERIESKTVITVASSVTIKYLLPCIITCTLDWAQRKLRLQTAESAKLNEDYFRKVTCFLLW